MLLSSREDHVDYNDDDYFPFSMLSYRFRLIIDSEFAHISQSVVNMLDARVHIKARCMGRFSVGHMLLLKCNVLFCRRMYVCSVGALLTCD